MFSDWPWWVWVLVFLVAWNIAYRLVRRVQYVGDDQKDEHGRLPAVVNSRDPKRPVHTLPVASGVHDGAPYEVRRYPGDDTVQPFLVVSRIGPAGWPYVVLRRGPIRGELNRMVRSMFWSLRTGDAAFDREFVIRSTGKGAWLSGVLSSPRWRESVTRLFDMGCTVVRSDGLGVDVLWMPFPPEVSDHPQIEELDDEGEWAAESPAPASAAPADDPARIQIALSCLAQLLSVDENAETVPVRASKWRAIVVLIASVATLATALLLFAAWGRDRYSLVGTPDPRTLSILGPGVVIGVVLMGLLCRRLRRVFSRPPQVMIFLFGTLFCMVATGMGLLTANAVLDRKPATVRVQRVVSVESDESGRVSALVEPWGGPEVPFHIPLPRDRGEQLKALFLVAATESPVVNLEITTKPGFFGWEWIQQVKVNSGNKVETQGSAVPHPLPET